MITPWLHRKDSVAANVSGPFCHDAAVLTGGVGLTEDPGCQAVDRAGDAWPMGPLVFCCFQKEWALILFGCAWLFSYYKLFKLWLLYIYIIVIYTYTMYIYIHLYIFIYEYYIHITVVSVFCSCSDYAKLCMYIRQFIEYVALLFLGYDYYHHEVICHDPKPYL